MKYKGVLFAAFLLVSMLFLAVDHRGNVFGDSLFRWMGIPTWSGPRENEGFHISPFIGLILLIISARLTVGHFRKTYAKAGRVVLLACIAFFFLVPFITERFMYVIHYNQTGITVIDYNKKKSISSFVTENGTVTVNCNLPLMNYGNRVETVRVRPTFNNVFVGHELSAVDFPFQEITLRPHSSENYSMTFTGKLVNIYSTSGTASEFGVEIVKDGLHKTIQ